MPKFDQITEQTDSDYENVVETFKPAGFFSQVQGDVGKLRQELLGPDYQYHRQIKDPKSIGMSDRGSLPQVARNVRGLIDYTEVLVTGGGRASKTGGPIGPKYFLKTGAKCKDKATGKKVTRYIYSDYVPKGNLPFISSGMGGNFSSFKGLIPGTMSNVGDLNPFSIFGAFMSGSTPACREINMETRDNNNNKSRQTHHVTDYDIKNMDPCSFSNKRNPISNKQCKEFFSTIDIEDDGKLPQDNIMQAYVAALGALCVYFVYKLNKGR